MGFYYTSIFSLVPLSVVYGLLVLMFVGVMSLTRDWPNKAAIRIVVGVVFLLLPISEELLIAWNFGQACKQAGTFISKKVEVDGFYDDTTGWGPRQLSASGYQFMESNDRLGRRLIRVEPADADSRDRALAWYREKNPRNETPKAGSYIVHPVSEREQVVVSPDARKAWRVVTIERSTARYQFRKTDPMGGSPMGHKVVRFGSVVVDSNTHEQIARYTAFSRDPPWFFVYLDTPGFACDAPGDWPNTRKSSLIYRDVLIPAKRG